MALSQKELDRLKNLVQERQNPDFSKFKPSAFGETMQDVAQTGRGIADVFKRTSQKQQAAMGSNQPLSSRLTQSIGIGAGGVSGALGEVFKGGVKAVLPQAGEDILKSGVQKVVSPIVESQPVQNLIAKYESLDENTKRDVDSLLGIGSFVTDLAGIGLAGKGIKAGTQATKQSLNYSKDALKSFEKVKSLVPDGAVVRDILPSKRGVINTELTKAFDLTQGDVKNIYKATGNQVGDFVAERNLIGNNLDDTVAKINNHYETNYQQVRDEISKVAKTYTPENVPRYKDALTQIKKVTDGVVGLEDVNKELTALLQKKGLTLSDVQRVKELMDDNLNLYKVTGDVQAGATKEGLSNLRNEIKSFIEKEVKDNTGADIAKLNNEVATSKTILNAIEDRVTRGSTRATITAGDVVTFLTGSGFGTPVGGVIAVLAKKLYQSPSFKLKFTKWLNKKSPEDIKQIFNQLQDGKLPQGIKTVANVKKKFDPTRQGGYISIGKKVVKEIDEPTKAELYDSIKFLKGETSKITEKDWTRLAKKFGINEDQPLSSVIKRVEAILDKTKTKPVSRK